MEMVFHCIIVHNSYTLYGGHLVCNFCVKRSGQISALSLGAIRYSLAGK